MSFLSRLFGCRKSQPAPAPTPAPVQTQTHDVFDFRHIRDLNNVSPLDTCSCPENADFKQLLEKYFTDCAIEAAVPASKLFPNAPAYAMPVNFLIIKGDKSLALILLRRGHAKRYSYLETSALCDENGIVCMPFFLHLPNEEDYVVERLKSVLG